ncbi:Mu transposase C-terminal domain-containing protein [Deinococcus sp. AJ005]|uniref:Mu transposase C-terminal domain-containing protein n=1 Tax=Deinococcus sp. AJ005 TaxID=2652443 RepID=UPI00125CB00D|nr:Mu transposase C-terminal domain-containing protein [Deinococcus sp. AJ005]QFP76275.1 transposase family protein [Deinococcus sp. AJ005]
MTAQPWPAINTVLRRLGEDGERRYERLLWISHDSETLLFINVFDPFAQPFFLSKIEFSEDWQADTLTALQDENTAEGVEVLARCRPPLFFNGGAAATSNEGDAQRRALETAWLGLTPILDAGPEQYLQPSKRRPLIRSAALKAGVSEKTIRRWLRTYLQLGQTKNALVPAYARRGGKGKPREYTGRKLGRPSVRGQLNPEVEGINVTGRTAEKLVLGINRHYIRGGRTPEQAYQATLEDSFSDEDWTGGYPVPVLWPAHRCPTKTQFLYWMKKTKYGDLAKHLTQTVGERRYGRELRPHMGRDKRRVSGPGEVYVGDGMVVPIHLLNGINPAFLNRFPKVYVFVDAFSARWVGVCVTYENLNYHSAKLALYNAASDKTDFLARYGIHDAEFAAGYLPSKLHIDGGEFANGQIRHIAEHLGLAFMQDPPYRPDLKGLVEGAISSLKRMLVARLDGTERSRKRTPGEHDVKLDARFTLDEFTWALLRTMQHMNKFRRLSLDFLDEDMLRDGVQPFPDEIWAWGLTHRPQHRRVVDATELALSLLPVGKARVTSSGLSYKNNMYWSQRGDDEQWWGREREREYKGSRTGPRYVEVSYDPWRMDQLYLRIPGEQTHEICTLKDHHSAFQARSFVDYDEWTVNQKALKQEGEQHIRQGTANYNADLQHQAARVEGRLQVHRAGRSKAARATVDAALQASEKALRREEDALSTILVPSDEPPHATSHPQRSAGYIAPPTFMDLLRSTPRRTK